MSNNINSPVMEMRLLILKLDNNVYETTQHVNRIQTYQDLMTETYVFVYEGITRL